MSKVKITYIRIPTCLYRLDISSLAEMSILALIIGFKSKGLMMSNTQIANVLNVDRRNVIRATGRLKAKGYIKDVGSSAYRRKLVVGDSGELSLLGSGESVTEIVANHPLNSGDSVTQKGRREIKEEGPASLRPPADPLGGDDGYSRFGTHPATPEEITALEAEGVI